MLFQGSEIEEVVKRVLVDFSPDERLLIIAHGDTDVKSYLAIVEMPLLKISPAKAKELISEHAKNAIMATKNKDVIKLSSFVHLVKGIRFSPYSYVDVIKDLIFSQSKIKDLFKDKTQYTWGSYDGSGEPIKLTFEEYYNRFIYDQDFANAKQIGYNQIIGKGDMINNGFEIYPNTIIVDYHFPGFDPKYEGMDWRSLRLVFEKKDEVWYIVGIIHDEWTI
jgi:hypothetical protein